MGTQLQLAAGEQAALARIRALAADEGERRFREAAEQHGISLGEYQGQACALVRDVARAFGVTDRAIQRALVDVKADLPGAAKTLVGEDLARLTNLKFASRTPNLTLVFWPGFLFCATRGRSAAAAAVVRTEARERTAAAAATVTAEEYSRVVAQRDELAAALEGANLQMQTANRQLAGFAERLGRVERRLAGAQQEVPASPLSRDDVERIADAVARRQAPTQSFIVPIAPSAPAVGREPTAAESAAAVRREDACRRLVQCWWQTHGEARVGGSELLALAIGAGVLRELIRPERADRGERAESEGMAYAVIDRLNRVYEGLAVRSAGFGSRRGRRYFLQPVAGGGAR